MSLLFDLTWANAGIGVAIVGTTLAAAPVRATGTDEQVGQWIPAHIRHGRGAAGPAFCSSGPDAPGWLFRAHSQRDDLLPLGVETTGTPSRPPTVYAL